MMQKGNALIFILIAIALLGLLTVTLSRSGDSTNETGSFEQNQILASEILSYAKSIENAVQMLLARGCSENDISFENSITGASHINPNSPDDKSCHVFDVAGTGLSYIENTDFFPNGIWVQPYNTFVGRSDILGVGTNNTNRSQELIWFLELPQNIDRERFCNIFNMQGGNNLSTIPIAGIYGHPHYTGTFSTNAFVNEPLLDGVHTACYNYSLDTSRSLIYHVLHAR